MQNSKLQIKIQNFWNFKLLTSTFNFSLLTFNFKRKPNGFTLIELLVSVSLFVVIGVFITQTLATILSNRQKADVAQQVRQEAKYAINVMERHLRGARSPRSCGSGVTYDDSNGTVASFSCTGSNPARIASSSGSLSSNLTSSSVTVSSCSFVCSTDPDKITISFTVSQFPATTDPKLTATTPVQTQVILRNR